MRITLEIADDVLLAVKERARREKKSVGELISELARQSIQQEAVIVSAASTSPGGVSERLVSYGIHALPTRGSMVSSDSIDRIRDVEGI